MLRVTGGREIPFVRPILSLGNTGDAGVKQLYGEAPGGADMERPEAVLGVPAVTASLIGTFQAMEVLKILLKRGTPFRDVMAHVDLENGRLEIFRFDVSTEKTK